MTRARSGTRAAKAAPSTKRTAGRTRPKHESTPAAGPALARGPKQWFELECRRCGARFVEMKDLVWHRCGGAHPSHASEGQPCPTVEASR
jgi:hypothetical protein